MTTLKDELRAVRSMFKDRARTAERRAEEAHRSWKNFFGDPARIAMEVLRGHDQRFDGSVCACTEVREGHSYQQHLVDVLNANLMLKVPPHMTGEGW